MKETAELLLKRTRSELVEMAEKLRINTAGVAKTTIAESIVEARKKAEKTAAREASKPRVEAPKVETPKVEVTVKGKLKPHIGKKGVFAKRAAIDEQIEENEEAVAVIGTGVREIQAGIKDMRSAMDNKAREMLQGVKEIHKGIGAQIKENEKAAAKMDAGVKEMHRGIDAQIKENEKAAAMMDAGVKELQNGIKEFQNETANYIKDFYYG